MTLLGIMLFGSSSREKRTPFLPHGSRPFSARSFCWKTPMYVCKQVASQLMRIVPFKYHLYAVMGRQRHLWRLTIYNRRQDGGATEGLIRSGRSDDGGERELDQLSPHRLTWNICSSFSASSLIFRGIVSFLAVGSRGAMVMDCLEVRQLHTVIAG
ncbi:unnamed protein product [Caenorhabditis auriculariae]|uniref:Uncharacterized protein n=1 Tax=Caenorhabditis auriculariae TaxID=2777116 RepID=A0A8S1H2Z9_9PELO|nr:unnamed protein product [Caenorhabditis auriculariae]